jgi:hypothetical protein
MQRSTNGGLWRFTEEANMRSLTLLCILAFSVVSSSAPAATGKKMDRATCTAMVEKAGTYTNTRGRTAAFGPAVARCMKGQPI